MLKETASQTAGPYLHIGLMPKAAGLEMWQNETFNRLVAPGTQGQRIRLEGTILDGEDTLVRDAMVELWQANGEGRYNHPGDTQDKPLDPAFRGWGRAVTDFKTGLWWFDTIKPGSVMGRSGRPMAPHVSLAVFARGINIQLNTRVYFDDEAEANARDPVLNLIEHVKRRATLIARREERDGGVVYRFDIRIQGQGETVFLDI